ncbi:MAG TPA: DUF3426 domain-containing protein [Oxalicibacterium sp.]|nr:DUF3426 domain-containing protein [Oxalicibacterium sp.]
MALATQCPHCRTTFRVAQDQLKLRAGLVRCGHCKEIFNGIEHLLPPTAKLQPAGTQPVAPPTPATDAPPVTPPSVSASDTGIEPPPAAAEEEKTDTETLADPPADRQTETAQASTTLPDASAPVHEEQEANADQPPATARVDPLQRMTLVDFTHELPDDLETYPGKISDQELSHAEETPGDQPDELEEAIRDLQNKPWRGKKKSVKRKKADPLDDEELEEEEPGFLKRGRRKQRLGRRLRIIYGFGSVLLLIAAVLQGAYSFRNQLAGSFPQTKPVLTQFCVLAGCRIDLPAQIASVSIESSELQTLASAKNKFVLTTLLRNYSGTAQEWPYIELTLNDASEKPLLRRVFKPAEYLPNRDEALAGFPAASERTIRINFALSQVQASGYRVYLFYP